MGQAVTHGLIAAPGSIFDFSAAVNTIPESKFAALPATCTQGQLGFNIPANNLVVCGASNNWTIVAFSPAIGQIFTSVTSVTIKHNFGTPNVTFNCYDNGTPPHWILPASASLVDFNTLTVTFSTALSGSCVVRN